MQELCKQHNLPTEVIEQKIVEGWEGKQKGLLQILWERGFVDVENLSAYTVDGRKDAFGVVQKETSLVDCTPKCHCEMAGEGIEYSRGCAKNAYRAKPIGEKRGKDTY